MRLGLVLGAGGSVGWAFHLGVLEGMAGASTAEVLDAITAPLSPEQREEMGAIYRRTRRRPWRYLRPQAPGLVRRGGIGGLAGLLPAGAFPTVTLRRFPTGGLDGWPEPLWLPSVRLDDGERVVFGRDRTDVAVADAVEATSAVPGLFQPKPIGHHRFIDGAVASATNADLLSGLSLDTVVVSSPMTRPGRGPIRRRAARQLRTEVAPLAAAGAEIIVVSPDESIMEVADGYPRHRPEAGSDIVAAARSRTVEAIERWHGGRAAGRGSERGSEPISRPTEGSARH